MHDAERARFAARNFDATDRYVRAGVHVLLQHELVIHLVDVVAREQHDVLRSVTVDDVDVLIHGVGGARIPLRLRDALARRQDVETLVTFGAEEVPTAL